MAKATPTSQLIVQAIPNPFGGFGFVLQIRSGKWANRGFIADGHSAFQIWDSVETAEAYARNAGYRLLKG